MHLISMGVLNGCTHVLLRFVILWVLSAAVSSVDRSLMMGLQTMLFLSSMGLRCYLARWVGVWFMCHVSCLLLM